MVFILLYEGDSEKSTTGNYITIHKDDFISIFNTEIPKQYIAIIEPKAFKMLVTAAKNIPTIAKDIIGNTIDN
ncbi:MAG: hypothetical protein ACTSQG_00060 [Promethearchaeota archaeon]